MIWISSGTSSPCALSLIVCDSHGNYSACSFTKIIGSLSCQAVTYDVPFASNGFLYFAYLENSCHPLRFNSDVNCSLKPALKYSLVELDALSSPIMLYTSCCNLLGWCLSPPLASKLTQHRTLSWVLAAFGGAWHIVGAQWRSVEYFKDYPSVVPKALIGGTLSLPITHTFHL